MIEIEFEIPQIEYDNKGRPFTLENLTFQLTIDPDEASGYHDYSYAAFAVSGWELNSAKGGWYRLRKDSRLAKMLISYLTTNGDAQDKIARELEEYRYDAGSRNADMRNKIAREGM